MILTCPQCSTCFQLSAEILSPEGKRVRCSSCKESWFQMPDRDELEEGRDEGQVPLEDIPDGVKPISEGSQVPALTEQEGDVGGALNSRRGLIGAFVAALLFFTLIFSGLLVMKNTVIGVWPESYVFYKALGAMDHVPGQGLIFDRLSAKLDGDMYVICLLYTSPSPRDLSTSRMPSSA